MHLPGRLAVSTLGDLLGTLHRNRTTGLLELTEAPRFLESGHVPGRTHRIHLFCGLVSGVETSLPVAPLGEILRAKGFLGPEGLLALLRKLASGDRRLAGEILVEDGLAVKPLVDLGLRAQLRSRLEALFTLKDAAVSFHTARPLSEAARKLGLLSSGEFLHGRPRARDRKTTPRTRTGQSFDGPERRVSPNRPWSARPQASSARETAAPREERVHEPYGHEPYGHAPPKSGRRDAARERALRTLGLSEEADVATIRRAFRKLAVELHPDRFATASAAKREQTSALFAEVSAAYHLLVA